MRARLPHALVLAAALVAALASAAQAGTQGFRVVVVPGLELEDVAALGDRAAIGLVVPGAGPRVSGESARAALERGTVRNSFRGGLPTGPTLIAVEDAGSMPALAERMIVLGLPESGDQENDRRYPIAVVGPGFEGLLTSERTRIPGLVSITDVAPTALDLDDGLDSRPDAAPSATLRDLDERIDENDRTHALAALIAGVIILALSLVLPRAALLGFPAVLAANLLLGVAGVSTPWVVLLVLAVAAAGGAALALLLRSPVAVGAAMVGIVGGYLIALALDGVSVALSPLGASGVSRFYGLSNLLSAILLVPALAGAALLQPTLGWIAATGAAALGLVTVAGSRFGADGGTAVVLCVAYALLAVELAGARRRVAVAVVAVAAAAVLALVAVDAWTGASSHLTDAVGGGAGGFADELRDRIVLSWEKATDSWYAALLVATGAAVLFLLAGRLVLAGAPREVRALPLAVALAVGVSLLVNDSPADVVIVGLIAYLAAEAYVLAESDAFAQPGGGGRRDYASVVT